MVVKFGTWHPATLVIGPAFAPGHAMVNSIYSILKICQATTQRSAGES
jgi:hypothetical protein